MPTLHPFQFASLPVRGRLIRIPLINQHLPSLSAAPAALQQALSEILTTAALLAYDAKSQATVTVQLQHPDLQVLLFAECTQNGDLRAYANPSSHTVDFPSLFTIPGGILAVTFQLAEGTPPYQSLIPLKGPTLASSLEDYFATSVQTPTLLRVFTGHSHGVFGTAALVLQQLPTPSMPEEDDWNRLEILANTLTTAEALPHGKPAETLLAHLFAEDDITLYSAQNLGFAPPAPRSRMLAALASLPPEEVRELLTHGPIQLVDETTGHTETFTHADLLPFLTASKA